MNPEAMLLHGRALLAYFRGDKSAEIKIYRDDGELTLLQISRYFRSPDQFSAIEDTALDLCKGSVLDIGAGGGIHSLALLDKRMPVTAIDVSAESVEVLKERGIDDVRCIDIFDLSDCSFDTLLMLGHGIGMVEDLPGLRLFLRHARSITSDDGQIVLDSLDARRTDNPLHLAYHEANRQSRRYFSEVRVRIEYEEEVGPLFGWLHVDPDTLEVESSKAGWKCEIVLEQDDGDYLAQLSKRH